MDINNQLVRPLMERLYDEYRELVGELTFHDSDETQKLKLFIQKKIQQLETLNGTISSLGIQSEKSLYPDLHEQLKQLKLELRFAQRRWKRQCLNEVRFKKSHPRTPLISTYAA